MASRFVETGSIEVMNDGVRICLGQYADNQFIIQKQFANDARALRRIAKCLEIVATYGKIAPTVRYI